VFPPGRPVTGSVVTGRRSDLPAAARRIHPTVGAVFEAAEAAGVRWCLLRGEGRLESPPHDIDVLVSASDLGTLLQAIGPLGFVPVPTWARGSHRFFVAYLASFDQWLVLDVVTELSYGPGYAIPTEAAEGCLSRRERVDSLSLLSADDAFWTLLFHCLLDRQDIAGHQRERLQRLRPAGRADSVLGRFAADLCPSGWDPERILAAVGAGQWAALLQLGPLMIRQWRRRHPWRYWARDLGDRARWRIAPVHTLVALRGLTVMVAGEDPDAARRLAADLDGAFYFPIRVLADAGAAGTARGGGARSLLRRLAAGLAVRYQRSRGRLVVAAAGSPPGRQPAVTALRPDVLVVLRRQGSGRAEASNAPAQQVGRARVQHDVDLDPDDLAATRRRVVELIWRAYGERRRWSAAA
jgi:hypothetical protein